MISPQVSHSAYGLDKLTGFIKAIVYVKFIAKQRCLRRLYQRTTPKLSIIDHLHEDNCKGAMSTTSYANALHLI
ncbi:hypothetical protein [Nostoc sp.]|uniref:hypothetical protein n=1 Tax=Nostoc sp. TaxID=1180 RepID=UPI002FF5A52B